MRMILIAAVLSVGLSFAAHACEGQTGSVIFRDNFADDSGGWEANSAWRIKPPEFIGTLEKQETASIVLNQTFNATDADYCVELVLPQGEADEMIPGAGLILLAKDHRNLVSLIITARGDTRLARFADGSASLLAGSDASAGFVKTDPGATNTLRVIAKAGTVTAMVNGKVLKQVRVQVPTGQLKFGLSAVVVPDQIPGRVSFAFRNFSVTSGQ